MLTPEQILDVRGVLAERKPAEITLDIDAIRRLEKALPKIVSDQEGVYMPLRIAVSNAIWREENNMSDTVVLAEKHLQEIEALNEIDEMLKDIPPEGD